MSPPSHIWSVDVATRGDFRACGARRDGPDWTQALGDRRGLYSFRKLVFRPHLDLARDRLHPQCRRPRRQCHDQHLLCRPGTGRSLPGQGSCPAHAASALQRPHRSAADPARHRLRIRVRMRRAGHRAAYAHGLAQGRDRIAVDDGLRRGLSDLPLRQRPSARRIAIARVKFSGSREEPELSARRIVPPWALVGGCNHMKIAQIAPLMESVPPRLYGGTERIVSYLADELVRLGHDVTLFASGDSVTRAKLVGCTPRALRLDPNVRDLIPYHMLMLDRVRDYADEFDVLHFHIDQFHFPLFRPIANRTVTTTHGRQDLPDMKPLYVGFSDMPLVSI